MIRRDGVRGDVFPAAAVHGGAGVFADGVEIHEPPEGGLYPLDTDDHAGQAVPEEWLAPPSAEFLAAAAAEAASPGRGAERRPPQPGRARDAGGSRRVRRHVHPGAGDG